VPFAVIDDQGAGVNAEVLLDFISESVLAPMTRPLDPRIFGILDLTRLNGLPHDPAAAMGTRHQPVEVHRPRIRALAYELFLRLRHDRHVEVPQAPEDAPFRLEVVETPIAQDALDVQPIEGIQLLEQGMPGRGLL
jgi:hypothetical protein